MEQATPILESFTENDGDGPSQPLLRKLMSLMLHPESPFSRPIIVATARPPEDCIAQQQPLEDVENIVQSGFRFTACDSPAPENYFGLPADFVDKVPFEALSMLNDALGGSRDSTLPRRGPHNITGFEQAIPLRRPRNMFCLPDLAASSSSTVREGHGQGDDSVISRLDRLEAICSRTESYLHMAFMSLDRRLQLLEGQQTTRLPDNATTRDTASCPMSPIFYGGSRPCDVGTFVTPDMLMPSGLQVRVDGAATADACLSPIESIPSPDLFSAAMLQQQQPSSQGVRAGLQRPGQLSGSDRLVQTDYFPLAVCSSSSHERTSEPLLVWNEGLPYLRRRVALVPQLRDAVVLPWDGVNYLSAPTVRRDNEAVTTYISTDDSVSEQRQRQDINTGTSLKDASTSEEKQNEVISVLEGMFTSLALSLTQPSDLAVEGHAVETDADCGLACCARVKDSDDGPAYVAIPQNDNLDEQQGDASSECEVVPKLTLAFNNQECCTPSHSSDMRVRVDLPNLQASEHGQDPPVTVHVAISPKRLPQQESDRTAEEQAASIVQDICISVEGPFQSHPECDIVQQLPVDSREAVAITKDKLHLTEDIVADYTLKSVRREQEGAATSGGPADQCAEVSSVIHELCFSVDVPLAESEQPAGQELPLELAISLSGDSPESARARESSLEPKKDIASIVLSLEALQKAPVPAETLLWSPKAASSPSHSSLDAYLTEQEAGGSSSPVAFNWEGVAAEGECQERRPTREDIPGVKEQVTIFVEVPTQAESEAEKSGVQIGIAVKTLPSYADTALIARDSMVPDVAALERVPFEDIVCIVERDVLPSKEELTPLTENLCQEVYQLELDDMAVEPLATPPPSPVDTEVNFFKEQAKFDSEEFGIESLFLVKDFLPPGAAKVPKPVVEAVDLIRGSLHYDGKSCLLSICMEDFWTTEDMCQTPLSPTSVLKPKSDLEPFCLRGCGMKPDKSRVQVFGFFQQAQGRDNSSFCNNSYSKSSTLGFLSLPGSERKSEPAAARPLGFDKRKPCIGKNLLVDLPVDNLFADWDSTLSVVSRCPVVNGSKLTSTCKQGEEQQRSMPDSPGARSCIIDGEGDGDISKQDKARVADSQACILKGESPKGGREQLKTQQGAAARAGGSLRKQQQFLDLLDATEFQITSHAGDLHVLPLESPSSSRSSRSSSQEEFFDALQCSGLSHSRKSRKLKRFFKDKILSRFACYGYGFAMVTQV